VGSATNEGAALSAGQNFANPANSQCPAELTTDTGWGLTDLTDMNCWSGSPITVNGEVVFDLRRQDYSIQQSPQCQQSTFGIKYLKSRQAVCPNKYASRTDQYGNLQCFIPPSCGTKCKNPVDFATGAKLHKEVDYRAADGLEFARFYNSQAKFRPRGTGGFVATRDDYWRHSFSRKLFPIVGNAHVSAYFEEDDGSLTFFDTNGVDKFNVSGAADRLQNLGVAGWALVRANSDVEYYSSAGRLTSIVTRTGVTTTLSYDANGRLETISNSFGRTLALGYDASDRLATLTLPDSSVISYGYDSKDRLTTVTYADST
jgi:YD repeat-containing protein